MKTSGRGLTIAVGLGILLNPLNSSMVSVAVARLQEAYRLDFTEVSWILSSFYIASAIAQPVMGKAGDLFGRRRIFLAGLIISFLASMAAPLSPSFGWLIVSRIVQSIGTSMLVAVGMALVRVHVTEKQGAALSTLSIFLSGAAAIGPFVGGVLIEWRDWPAIFLVNIPFVAASFLLAWKRIPKEEPAASAAKGMSKREWLARIDAPGILLFAIGLVALLVGLLSAKASGEISLRNILVLGVGLVSLTAFLWRELRATSPFIPLRTFAKYPALTRVNVQFLLVNLLFYAIFFGLPSYLQVVRQVSEFHTGMIMLVLGASSLIASPVAGKWIDKSGPKPALLVSAILMAAGSAWLVTLTPTSPVIGVSLALAAFGISNGLNAVGMQAALFDSSPKEIAGVASGLFNTSRYLGTILSSLLTGILMGGAYSFSGFRQLGVCLTIIALALVAMNLPLRKKDALSRDGEVRS